MKQQIIDFFNQDFTAFFGNYVDLVIHTQNGANVQVLCPFHEDTKPSFSFNKTTGQCKCFGCAFSGDPFSFYAKLKGLSATSDFPKILNQIASDFGIEKPTDQKPRRKLVGTYDYVDENGKLLFQVCRYEPKDFRQRRPDGKGGWVWKLGAVQRVLYRLPGILKSDYVLLVEGEKDADKLFEIGLVATTNPGGASKWDGLQKKHNIGEPLRGKDVVIIPDNDPEGREDAQMKAQCLQGVAKTIKILTLPGLLQKGDVSDYIQKQNDTDKANERLCQMIEGCEPWKPETSTEGPEPQPPEERLTIHSVQDLLETEFKYVTPIISEGILPQGAGLILAGEGGVGKSLILLEWIVRLVMGWKILDIDVPTSRTIKIFQAENPMSQVQFRLRKILQGFQITSLPNQIFFSDPRARYDLKVPASIKKIKAEVLACGADLFILDPLSSFHKVNENDNILIRNVLDNVTDISRETGAAAIIIHHFGKPVEGRDNSYRTRGAMSIRDWADTLVSIIHKKHENKILRVLDFIKIRNGPQRPSVLVRRDENFIHEITEEDMLVSVSQVKEILEDHLGGQADKKLDFVKAITSQCNCSDRTAYRAIERAVDMKVLVELGGPGKAKKYKVSRHASKSRV